MWDCAGLLATGYAQPGGAIAGLRELRVRLNRVKSVFGSNFVKEFKAVKIRSVPDKPTKRS
jgi:hypothetical protein